MQDLAGKVDTSIIRRVPCSSRVVLIGLLAFAGLMMLFAQPALAAYPEVGTPPMNAGATCTSCHTTYPTTHSLSNCTSCHSYAIGDPHYSVQPPGVTAAGSCLGGDYACHTKGPQSAYVHGSATDYFGDVSYLAQYGESYTGSPMLYGNYGAPYACVDCHNNPLYPTVPSHDAAALATQHQSTTPPAAGCFATGCHNSGLITEHAKYPAGTNKYQCSLCHSPDAPAAVKDAVAGGFTNCDACHTGAGDHAAIHVTATPAVACQASGCHPGATLIDVHGKSTCATCHSSADPTVTAAIAAGDKRCATCHPTADHAAIHVTATPAVACQAAGCHPGATLIDVHSKSTCATCHSSADPIVTAAIAAGDKRCATCHPTTDHAAIHVTATPAAPCQASGCHPGTNLLPIHSAITCAGCHQSSNPLVTGAIAAADKRCLTCHPTKNTPHGAGVRTWGTMDYYAWTSVGQSGSVLASVGANPTSPGVHGDYQTTTAKCGICHSVHRAKAGGVKLLNTDTATCAGCHIAGTSAVTNVVIALGHRRCPARWPPQLGERLLHVESVSRHQPPRS